MYATIVHALVKPEKVGAIQGTAVPLRGLKKAAAYFAKGQR